MKKKKIKLDESNKCFGIVSDENRDKKEKCSYRRNIKYVMHVIRLIDLEKTTLWVEEQDSVFEWAKASMLARLQLASCEKCFMSSRVKS